MHNQYRQCTLRKGEIEKRFYLPERMAVVGKEVRLRNRECTWSDGWIVAEVGRDLIDDEAAEKNCLRRVHAWKPLP